MKELFKNKTKYTKKEFEIFLKAHQKEYGLSETLFMGFNIVFFSICMILAFKVKEFTLAIAILIGLIIYIWYKLIRPIKRIEKDKKSNKFKENFTNTFKFYKNYFTVENMDGTAQILYLKIYRVVETNSYFYIYISREYAFIIAKKGFENVQSEEFGKFIKKKVRMKYKNRKTKAPV